MTAIRGTTRLAAVLGWPVEHSRSPELLNAAFEHAALDAVMVPMGVAPEHLADAVAGLRAIRALGASVTIPHKRAVRALCDELAPDARAIGAVNCLELRAGRLIGHNTDATGFGAALAAAGFEPARAAHAVVLGAGGAARAVVHALRAIPRVEVVARRAPADWEGVAWRPWEPAPLEEAFARADLIVDCTPIGLGGPDEAAAVDRLPLDRAKRDAWVATLVYHRPTILLERASAAGHSTLDGRGMLVHQAAHAFSIWTSLPAPLAVMHAALARALRGT